MPIRDRITWGKGNPFADPRLDDLPGLIRGFKRGDSRGWRTRVFKNLRNDLPIKQIGYYREYYVGPPNVSGSLRIVLGGCGEVYVTGNHYDDFRQVIGIPGIGSNHASMTPDNRYQRWSPGGDRDDDRRRKGPRLLTEQQVPPVCRFTF